MAKISANYEVVYIIDPAQGEEAVAATVAKFQSLAEQNATDVVVDEWGKRRLAYAIDYKTEGYYVLMSFTSRKPYYYTGSTAKVKIFLRFWYFWGGVRRKHLCVRLRRTNSKILFARRLARSKTV